jgi:heat shock protein HtpX
MAKRVFLFVLTNIAILLTVSVAMSVLGALGIVRLSGGGQGALIVFCLVWGMGASLVSLAMSRQIARWSLGVKLVDGATGIADFDWLYNTVGHLARQANLPMPQVGVYESPEVNAFATGPTRKRSLVAVSTGLLRGMSRSELQGVLGHEMAHIANGDMVTMTLVQGVVNAFVLYLSHLVAAVVRSAVGSRDAEDRGPSFVGLIAGQVAFLLAQILFGLLGSLVTSWFSRRREFRADRGGAQLAGPENMIAALRRLMATRELIDTQSAALASFKIAGRRGFLDLFSTHPPLEQRVAALEAGR